MARLFNGTSDRITMTGHDISKFSVISISFWMYVASLPATQRIIFTTGVLGAGVNIGDSIASYGNNTAKIAIEQAVVSSGSKFWTDTFPAPSAAAWHHYLYVMDRATPINKVWVDSVAQTLTTVAHTASGLLGNYTNNTFELGTYNATSFLPGTLADFAVWGGVTFGAGEATNLRSGMSPLQVRPDRLAFFLPLDGAAANREQSFGRMGDLSKALLVNTGTTGAAGPFGQRVVPRPKVKVFA